MGKKIEKNEVVKIAAQNIKEARDHLSTVQHFADRDLYKPAKTMNDFRRELSENLEQRIKNLDAIVATLNGGKKDIRLDPDILGDVRPQLAELGEFLVYLKESIDSDASTESPNMLIDSIHHLLKYRVSEWNEMVDNLDDVFFNLDLSKIRED